MGEKSPFENLVNAVRADDITDQRHAAEVAETIIEESPEVRTFNAPSLYFPTGRVYGGQMVAQALMSAGMSVETKPGRLPHSFHGYFVSPGDMSKPIDYRVEVLRDGRSFSERSIRAYQGERTLLTAIASFQVSGQEGLAFADQQPSDVPDPESLPSSISLMEPFAQKSPLANYFANESSWDIRHCETPVVLAPDTSEQGRRGVQMVWMRATTTGMDADALAQVKKDQLLQRALLATGCDQIMMEPALRRAGLSYSVPGMSFTSLDHSMWWYQSIDVTRWHLYVQDAPVARHSRALCRARVFQDGKLRAEITQEAMIRVPQAK